MVLVQNKIDLISQSEIDQWVQLDISFFSTQDIDILSKRFWPPVLRLEAERLAAECNMKLYRTSVKEDLNVAVVFQHLAENYVNKVIWNMMNDDECVFCI